MPVFFFFLEDDTSSGEASSWSEALPSLAKTEAGAGALPPFANSFTCWEAGVSSPDQRWASVRLDPGLRAVGRQFGGC